MSGTEILQKILWQYLPLRGVSIVEPQRKITVKNMYGTEISQNGAAPQSSLHGKSFCHAQTSSQKLVFFARFFEVLVKNPLVIFYIDIVQ